jgi:hypothetical protein
MTAYDDDGRRTRVTGAGNRRWLTPGVGAVGAASFFIRRGPRGDELGVSHVSHRDAGGFCGSTRCGRRDQRRAGWCDEAGRRTTREQPRLARTDRIGRLPGHRIGDRSYRRRGDGVASWRFSRPRLDVSGRAVAIAGRLAFVPEPGVGTRQDIWARASRRQPRCGSGPAACCRVGGPRQCSRQERCLGGHPACPLSGRDSRPVGVGLATERIWLFSSIHGDCSRRRYAP